MSDQAKTSRFSTLLRPAQMVLVGALTFGLGVGAASWLQSGKSRSTEENHASPSDDIQTQEHPNDPVLADNADARSQNLPSHPAETPAHEAASEVSGHDSHPTPHHASSSDEHSESHADAMTPEEHATVTTELQASSEDPLFSDPLFLAAEEPDMQEELLGSDIHGESALEPPQENHPADDSHHAENTVSDHAASQNVPLAISDSHAERSASPKPLPTTRPSAQPAGVNSVSQELVTQQAVNLMTIADEDLASGNYVQAMQAYQSLRSKSDGVPGTAILFRLALCAEAAGRHAAAIEAYRKISGTQPDPAWAGVARYGEARCLSAMKRHEGLQTDLLRRAVLDETEFLPTVRGEVLHLIGRDLWREQTTMANTDLLDDQTLIVPEWSADPVRILDELPMLIHETPVKIGSKEFQVLHLKDGDPDETVLRLHCGMTRVETLLKNVLSGCHMKFELSEMAKETLQGRTQKVHVTEQSLSLLLDGITISSGVAWQMQDAVIQVLHPEEMSATNLRQSRLNAAERILRIAVMDDPGSPQAGHSRLALSTLLFEQKRAADALQYLQVQIESSPRSVVETEAAFNLGKCLMILNQRDEAVQAFLRSIDASGGLTDVRIASYIFHSRMLLEDNHGKMAIQSMMRGLSLSEGSELKPFAALHLASIYLVLGNPQGANSVLMDRRDELADSPGRKGAAFLSSLARFRAAVLADRREREGAAVVSALTEFDSTGYCGGHWAVLVAGACEELGLTQESTDAYVLALKKLPPSDLRNKTILRLAARYQAENQLEEARLLLATLTSAEATQMSVQARLDSAEVALKQNRPDEAISVCRLLIDSTNEPQTERAALRIMGQAYERQQNHQAAIYCFAGLLPEQDSADGLKQSTQSETSGGHK